MVQGIGRNVDNVAEQSIKQVDEVVEQSTKNGDEILDDVLDGLDSSNPLNNFNLVHMSQYADEINEAGLLGLPGDIFAGPVSNANLSGFPLTWKTGLPSGEYKPVFIPKEAEKHFSKVTPIGFYTGWQRFIGKHQYTARGTLNLKTGEFTRTGVNWSQVQNYGADILINTGLITLGFLYWNNRD